MSDHRVSVIVPTFNRAHYLRECLDSLLAQSVPAWEILVVDDGSEDATAEVAASYGNSVHYLRKDNGGKPSAVNLALSHANGDLIWLFDDDDVALPSAIESRLAALDRHPDADFVYSAHYVGHDDAAGRIARGRLYSPPWPGAEAFLLELMKSCFFHLNGALVPRRCYVELGGIDPSLRTGEDYDFQIRLARIARPAYCPTPSFVFRQHAGLRGAKADRYTAERRNRAFRESSAVIGRKVLESVPLKEFLVPRRQGDLDDDERRRALINRIQVLGNLGCPNEMFGDIRSVLDPGGTRRLSNAEACEIGKALRMGYAYESAAAAWPDFLGFVEQIRNLPGGRRLLRALSLSILQLARGDPGPVVKRLGIAARGLQLLAKSTH